MKNLLKFLGLFVLVASAKPYSNEQLDAKLDFSANRWIEKAVDGRGVGNGKEGTVYEMYARVVQDLEETLSPSPDSPENKIEFSDFVNSYNPMMSHCSLDIKVIKEFLNPSVIVVETSHSYLDPVGFSSVNGDKIYVNVEAFLAQGAMLNAVFEETVISDLMRATQQTDEEGSVSKCLAKKIRFKRSVKAQ